MVNYIQLYTSGGWLLSFLFILERKEVTLMMEYLLSLSQDLLKVFLTIVVTAYANKFANTLFKKSKRATPRRRKQGSSKRK